MQNSRFSTWAFGIVISLIVVSIPSAAIAQQWPARPVKVIVPLGPGSGTDVIARIFTDRLSARWSQPVLVENRPGGDGVIGIMAFLSANDDHVLLFTATSVFTGHPYLHDKLPYDPSDLIPVAQVNDTPVVVAVPTALNVSSMKELVDIARARPNALNAAAITGLQDLIFNGFLNAENVKIAKVPYRDTVQALNDLAENRIQILLTSVTIVQSQVQAGEVKIIATTSRQRQPVLPNTPTVSEEGFPSLTVEGGSGFFVPKIMNPPIRSQIAADVIAVADADPGLRDRFAAMGQVLHTGPSPEFLKLVNDQRARAADAAQRLGIKPAQP
ncbi:MAG TPA: tripartite tricarboxylate transporter substrate binding protein [Xanthobacteraceae bacterium]|jgi:tripartite-type tricarboxylate transporter receptor subunit TctC